jgi:ATP-dependent exoDNAse (exonuclease V) alpha subunit
MAIHHSSFGIVSRSTGGSAVASAAYNTACRMVELICDKATGIYTQIIHDYSKKKGVVYSEIMAPEIAQGMFKDREDLWNKVQLNETRKDARYSRKLTLALPKELDLSDNIHLLQKYIEESFVMHGMIADFSVHMDDENNPHAHVQLTMRNIELNDEGKPIFGLKNRSWDKKEMLLIWRSLWAVHVNKELELRGLHDRISELSHEERGIELTPGIKEGPARYMKSAERRELNSEIQRSNEERIRENPELIIDKLSINKAAFTKVDIAREVGKYFGVRIGKSDADLESLNHVNASEFLTAYEKVLSSEKLAILTKDSLNGEILYTSSARIKLEQRLIDTVSKLNEDYRHSLGIVEKDLEHFSVTETIKENIKGVGKAIESTLGIDLGIREGIELSNKQKQAVLHALNGPSISVIEGLPGAGKSTVVREISRQLKKAGYRVFGGAVSSSASRNLAEAGGIFTQNLTKWRYDIESYERELTGEKFNPALALNYYEQEHYLKRSSYFTNKDVFILDEMSMVSLPDLDFIKNEILRAGGKIIDLGDNNQLGAIKLQGASSKATSITGSFILDEVRRQENPLHRKATQLMSQYKLKEALEIYKDTKVFETADSREKLRVKLVNDYASEYLKVAKEQGNDHLSAHSKMAIIAYTNQEVRAINLLVREKLKTAGIIKGESLKLATSTGSLELNIGEQIVFTRNSKKQGVENGDVGIVKGINGNSLTIEVIRDGKSINMSIDTKDYKSIDYGYALTIYKAQGKTYESVRALFESLTGYEVFNVMMTRHTKTLKCYIDQEMVDSNLHNNVVYKEQEKLTSAILNSITRRAKSEFSIDYMNSENLPEVKTLKAYIEAKEDVLELHKAIEREKNEVFKKDGIHISTWESKYAEDYKEVLDERKQLAQQICKDFDSYKGLISQTRLSFDVIAAHAGLEGYKKEYSKGIRFSVAHQNNITHSSDILQLAQHVKEISSKEHGPLFKGTSEPLRSEIESICSKLNHAHEESVVSIKELELKVSSLRQGKYKAEAELTNARYFVEEAFPYILGKTFKDGEAALKAWYALKELKGISGALHEIKKDASSLGKLQGMGLGSFIALSKTRGEALAYLRALPANLEKYENLRTIIIDRVIELKENHWDREIAAVQATIKELESTMLDSKSYEIVKSIRDKAVETESLIEIAKDKDVQSWINNIRKASNAMEQKERREIGKDNKSSQVYNNNLGTRRDFKVERESLSFDEVNARLTRYAKELGYELLPQVTGDKVEEGRGGVLKCGSIMLETEGTKAGLWFRFSKGEGGNLFDLIKEANGYSSSVESLKWGAEWLGMSKGQGVIKHNEIANVEDKPKQSAKTKESVWRTVSVVPGNAPEPNVGKCFAGLKESHTHDATYEYCDIKGATIGYVVRFQDKGSSTKQTLPLVWAENTKTGRQGWRSQGFEGKPIYGLEKLSQDRKTVLIVEGEKTADSASQLLPEYTVISWLGGTNSAVQVDWGVLAGRKVVIWPDCDQPGMKAAEVISNKLEGIAQDIAIVNPYLLRCNNQLHENILPAKWDLADNLPQGMNQESIREAIKSAQNARLELTSDIIMIAVEKAGIDDRQLYVQALKQAKELAATSKLYPDSESLVKHVVGNVKAAYGLIQDIGFTAEKDALELNDIVRGGAIGNKFHEALLSHIYLQYYGDKKEASLEEKLTKAISKYDENGKTLTVKKETIIDHEVNTACDSLLNQGVNHKVVNLYKQAVTDILMLDKVTTQAIHKDRSYFKEINEQIRYIFIENKDLMQASDALNESTIKSLYNQIFERVVCNEKLADSIIKANDAFALNHIQQKEQRFNSFLKAYKVEFRDIQKIQPNFNIEKLQDELRLASESDRESIIEGTWLRIFKAYASAEINKLEKARKEAKTLDEMMKVFEQERDFSKDFSENYSELIFHPQLEVLRNQVRNTYITYHEKPTYMNDIRYEAENILKLEAFTENRLLQELKQNFDHGTVSSNLFKISQSKMNEMIISDLNALESGKSLIKDGMEFKDKEVYAGYILEHKDYKPYIKGTAKEKQLLEFKQMAESRNKQLEGLQHEQQRQKQLLQQQQHSKGLDMDR